MSDVYEMLQKYHHIAVVGISAKPDRPSHFVALYLQSVGYDIIPINPQYAGRTLLGKRVYASLTEASEAGEVIEIVDVFRRAQETPPLADEAARVGAKVLWLQQGIINDETGEQARAAGLDFVQDRCLKVEHARFFAGQAPVGSNASVSLSEKLD